MAAVVPLELRDSLAGEAAAGFGAGERGTGGGGPWVVVGSSAQARDGATVARVATARRWHEALSRTIPGFLMFSLGLARGESIAAARVGEGDAPSRRSWYTAT